MKPVKTAVIGCGAISDIYIENMMHRFSTLEVVACCASHFEHAQAKAAKHGIRPSTVEEILASPDIELVVILTPAPSHFDLIRRALLAGKHVYTEKPLTTQLSEARELLELSRRLGLRLGSAPETFMGSALQTARQALDTGLLGSLTSFHVVANRDLTLLASLFHFLRQPGGGIAYDYGVYYLTALVSLLGPVHSFYAHVSNFQKVRRNIIPTSPEYGSDYVYDNESQVHCVLETRSGIPGTFSLNGDSAMHDQAYFTIHGTRGILQLGDANQFGGTVRFLPNDPTACAWQTLPPVSALSDNCRGIGPSDMGLCIRNGGTHLASQEMACHVLDIVETLMHSAQKGLPCQTATECERPAAFTYWRELMKN